MYLYVLNRDFMAIIEIKEANIVKYSKHVLSLASIHKLTNT